MTNQWRGQDLGFEGNEQVQTPSFDQLAKESDVFLPMPFLIFLFVIQREFH
ncbi:hypothetical protein MKD41_01225 [Lutibacter sp. A64]|uniref:hypothetical protein n=1 Tax=Lutibacter sp. A64 TaxID=2918526 RepID=UPI001F05D7D7|nr:hypothetical protein [Lutibacter sp. A64]UMB54113.1 hypothetical protein MKD41_01225 [Lutibacter sp. A64]